MPEDWVKADISEYDSSMSLISYELATPEMAKVGEPVDPFAGLSEEERKALEEEIAKKKSALRKGTPTLSKNAAKSRSKEPTAVELKTSGAYVGDIPASQPDPSIAAQPGEFAFVTYGWGHGVGMSQNGANFYAAYAGWTYQDILFHYYPGTYLMNTGLTDEEELTIAHEPAGDTLKVVSEIVNREVGGSFSYEAIKAQAVAVYTYIKYNGDDSKDLRGKPNPPQVVIDACEEVLGEALYYDDNYALTVFSASSGGCSANCYEVFYADYPYLRSVPSDYDAAFDPHWGTVTYMSAETVKKKLETAYNITLSDDPGNWIQPVYSDETGYVTEVLIDGQTYAKGYPFSMMMGLKSSKFNLTYTYD
jgi:peptidoglycan hydrolase-like amidase